MQKKNPKPENPTKKGGTLTDKRLAESLCLKIGSSVDEQVRENIRTVLCHATGLIYSVNNPAIKTASLFVISALAQKDCKTKWVLALAVRSSSALAAVCLRAACTSLRLAKLVVVSGKQQTLHLLWQGCCAGY